MLSDNQLIIALSMAILALILAIRLSISLFQFN